MVVHVIGIHHINCIGITIGCARTSLRLESPILIEILAEFGNDWAKSILSGVVHGTSNVDVSFHLNQCLWSIPMRAATNIGVQTC